MVDGAALGGGFRRSVGRIPRLSEILLSRALLRDGFWFEPHDSESGNLFAVGQTVGQPTRTLADIGDLAHATDATLAGIPRQRFCPDTEEVIGSDRVSPTSNIPSQMSFAGLRRTPCNPTSNQRAGSPGAHDQLSGRPY
jgi:hypothetical protein